MEHFYWACFHGHLPLVEAFLLNDQEVNVNWQRPYSGFAAIHAATQQGHFHVVARLLQVPGIDVNLRKSNGSTAFIKACYKGHLDIVRLLLEDPRVDVNLRNHSNITGLYMAAQNGHLEVVQALLASKHEMATQDRCDTEDPHENGRTPVEWARLVGTLPKYPYMDDETYRKTQRNGHIIADLIEAYEQDLMGTRQAARSLPEFRGKDFFPPVLSAFKSSSFLLSLFLSGR